MNLKKYSNIIATIIIASSLVSCIEPVVVGAAAAGAGATYVAKDERTFGTIVDDASITTEAKAKFAKDDLVSTFDIHVTTDKAVVTLTGKVHSYEALRRANAIVKHIKGVRKIVNKLVVSK